MIKLNFKKKSGLDAVMDSIIEEMLKLEPNSDEYTAMAKNLETISKAKSYEKEKGIKLDTIVFGIVNLLGIVMILKHEKIDIIATKALGFVLKWRV
jgi:hypothetical protein